jgi:formylglycine-generating enzyme
VTASAVTASFARLALACGLFCGVGGCGKDLYFGPTADCAGHAGPTPVRAGSYCIDSTEVTVADYSAFLADTPSLADQADDCSWNQHFEPQDFASEDLLPPASYERRKFPIDHVDFCDARAYCAWAGKRLCGKLGGGELSAGDDQADSEWFSACSSDGKLAYPYGNDFDESACAVTGDYHTVGSQSSCEGAAPGVYDLIGNVWEWEDSCTGDPANPEMMPCSRRGGAIATMPSSFACADTDPSPRRLRQGDMGIRCCSDLAAGSQK